MNGDDDLDAWKVAMKLPNKQLQTADEQCSLGSVGKLTLPYYKKKHIVKCNMGNGLIQIPSHEQSN